MESIPRYIAGKTDPSTVHYETPLLRPILEVTYGCMVYQEQVMQIVRDLAGYSLGRSDLMRRAMAKKKRDVMAKEREYFIDGMTDEAGNVVIDGAVRRGVAPCSGREDLRRNERLCQLCFQQKPCRGLCHGGCADRLAQAPLSRAIYGCDAQLHDG